MLFSQTAEYALRAAVYLATGAGPRVTQQIAEVTRVPPGYLSKVLQSMGRAGLVQAQRGIGGGFVLTRPPAQITVLDVLNAVDPVQRIHTCPLQLESHGANLCPLHRKLDDALASIEDAFRGTSLEDLLKTPTTSQPLCDLAQVGMSVNGEPGT